MVLLFIFPSPASSQNEFRDSSDVRADVQADVPVDLREGGRVDVLENLQGRPLQEIRLHRDNVFTEDTGWLSWLYNLANKIHVKTRPFVIRNEILLREGEPYDSLRMSESVRLLRERGLFEEVRGWAEPSDSGVVAHIHTHDYWTLDFQTGFSKEGGKTEILLGIFDSNILGTGNVLSFSRRWSTDRNQSRWAMVAPRVLGRRENIFGEYRDNTDGIVRGGFFGHAYENHIHPWSYGIQGHRFSGRYRIYESEEDVARLNLGENRASVYVAKYPGVGLQVGGGLGASLYDFEPDTLILLAEPRQSIGSPVPQRLRMGLLTVGLQKRRFIQTRNLNRYGGVENYPLGWSTQLFFGHNFTALGGDDERNYTGLGWQFSSHPGGRWWFSGSGFGSIFWKGDRVGHRRVNAQTLFMRRHNPRHLTAFQFTGRWGEDLPTEERIYLGADQGLRGYPLRSLEGTQFLLFNLEHRLWTPVKVLFTTFGLSLYWDSALVSGPEEDLGQSSWKHGTGVGILMGSHKSSSGILRIELGWRLDRKNSVDLVISMGRLLRLVPSVDLYAPVVDVFDHRP
jgi:hypothetical protein